MTINLVSLVGYWLPFVVNAVVYSIRIHQRIKEDKIALQQSARYYDNWLKLGHIIGYIVGTVVPVVNLVWFIFNTSFSGITMLYDVGERLYDIRIVRQKKQQPRRESMV